MLSELAKQLRDLSKESTDPLRKQIDDVDKRQEVAANKVIATETVDERQERLDKNKKELDVIRDKIYRKQISLEYFWRNVMHFMSEAGLDTVEYSENELWKTRIQRLMKNGEAFELIDGENLEFKG